MLEGDLSYKQHMQIRARRTSVVYYVETWNLKLI